MLIIKPKIEWYSDEYFFGFSIIFNTRNGISNVINLNGLGNPYIVKKEIFGKFIEFRLALLFFMITIRFELSTKA